MQQKSSLSSLSVVQILGIVVVMAAAAFLLGRKSGGAPSQPSQVVTSETVETATGEMANWKPYTTAAFSFKYPEYFPDLVLRPAEYGARPEAPVYQSIFFDATQTGGGPGYTARLLVIGPEANPSSLSLEQWVEAKQAGTESDLTFKQHLTEVDGQPAVFVVGKADGMSSATSYSLFFTVENQIYEMHYQLAATEQAVMAYTQVFDQILSSFAFRQ